jgi:hypothetical protein
MPPVCPDFSDIVNPPTSAPIPFESVVVTNVEGLTSSDELRKAAVDHMKLLGNNYVGIPHDRDPVNEFINPSLFPMTYPTLFPYDIGGCEKRRKTPLGMRTHIKHFLFNLSDRRFQEHYSFLSGRFGCCSLTSHPVQIGVVILLAPSFLEMKLLAMGCLNSREDDLLLHSTNNTVLRVPTAAACSLEPEEPARDRQ